METTEIKQLADQFASLTVKEVGELASILRNEHGLEVAISTVQLRPAGYEGDRDYSVSNSTLTTKGSFNVVLRSAGMHRNDVIKATKKLLRIGLMEAKELVDKAPVFIAHGQLESEAKFLKKELEIFGADVEIREL